MSDESGFSSTEEIRSTAQRVVSAGQDVRNKLDELTRRALQQRDLAEQEVREVLQAVTEGVSLGAQDRANEVSAAVSDALQGMDDALKHAAEAMQLTLGEATSHAQDFAEHDLKQGLSDLKSLEEMFLDTVSQVAQSANDLVRTEMNALVAHARSSGTGTGERVRSVVEELSNQLRATAHEAGDAGKRAAREVGVRFATLASRKLSELASRIEAKAQALKSGQ